MILQVIATVLCLILAAVTNAGMDLSAEGKLGKRWNKDTSSSRKWKKGHIVNTKPLWYYLWLYRPMYKERFFWSSTILVGYTDFWHAAQLIFHTSWQAALAINLDGDVLYKVIGFVIIKVIFSMVFQIFHGAK